MVRSSGYHDCNPQHFLWDRQQFPAIRINDAIIFISNMELPVSIIQDHMMALGNLIKRYLTDCAQSVSPIEAIAWSIQIKIKKTETTTTTTTNKTRNMLSIVNPSTIPNSNWTGTRLVANLVPQTSDTLSLKSLKQAIYQAFSSRAIVFYGPWCNFVW
jgi:hypothetical protein